MFINSQSLINMAKKRLCFKASKETREVMRLIRQQMFFVDVALFDKLMPECHYRNGYCPELVSCGMYKFGKKKEIEYIGE